MSNGTDPQPSLLCRRDAQGAIVAVSRQALSLRQRQSGHWESVPADSAEVQAFLGDASSQVNSLSESDAELARVLEDLIDVLITRGLIQFTDLPEAAQAKLMERRQTRSNLTHRLQLLPMDRDDGLI